MDKKTYKQAVKEARAIFVYVAVSTSRRQALRVSKVKAIELVRQVDDGAKIGAIWASDDHNFLLVG